MAEWLRYNNGFDRFETRGYFGYSGGAVPESHRSSLFPRPTELDNKHQHHGQLNSRYPNVGTLEMQSDSNRRRCRGTFNDVEARSTGISGLPHHCITLESDELILPISIVRGSNKKRPRLWVLGLVRF